MSKILKTFQFGYEYVVDCWRTLRFNSYSPLEDKNRRLFYHLLIETHTIEKALSLPNPRPLFGKQKITSLIKMAERYDITFSPFPIQMLGGALKEYLSFHESQQIVEAPILDHVRGFFKRHPDTEKLELMGGTKNVTDVYEADQPRDYAIHFLKSRYSCRRFDSTPLGPELIQKIVSTAQSAPSQCNRQTSRVHYYSDPKKIDALLKLQAGSNGFREDLGNLFVVTSELTGWGGAGQRNQVFVDGALFSMFLMLVCHAHGVASCPLNLAKTNADEKKIKLAGDIPARERLIMMIGIGKTSGKLILAARSPRLPLERVLNIH